MRFGLTDKENEMGKQRQSNKEMKKKPLLNPKERKAAKQARKHEHDVVPIIVPR